MLLPVSFMRGGTSKAAVVHEKDLPQVANDRDEVLIRLMGGGDPFERQLDGLGGGSSSTSKVAIVGPGYGEFDVTYTFAQVHVGRHSVDYHGTCGNISAAIGPFAINRGLVTGTDPRTVVRILNTNTGTIFVATVPTRSGRFDPEGDYSIAGVAGTGAPIKLEYLEPAGAVTGALFPTGSPTDQLGFGLSVSVLDVANPVVFMRATDVGVSLGEGAVAPIPDDPELLRRLEAIRIESSLLAGMAVDPATASASVVPRVALVAIDPEATLRVSMISAGRPHAALPFTGAMATAAAAMLPGTVVNAVAGTTSSEVILRHPAGRIELEVEVADGQVARVISHRTARELMYGWAEVPVASQGGTIR